MSVSFVILLVTSMALSAAMTFLIVRYQRFHLALTGDSASGIQKFHAYATPRIGGVPIALAFLALAAFPGVTEAGPLGAVQTSLALALATSAPVFLIGLLEDITKRISPAMRLAIMGLAALTAAWFGEVRLNTLEVPVLDSLLAIGAVSIVVSAVAMVGVANAFNIIDGYNGLVGMVSVMVLLALGSIASMVGDDAVAIAAISLAGAVLGFLAWNYPNGRIFAGDGGAYFIGFVVALLSIVLVERNSGVSPWFPLALVIYPVWETLFSMYRRRLRARPTTNADRLHLHQLVYCRLARFRATSKDARDRTVRNSLTSPYLWLLASLSIVPALVFWNNTAALQLTIIGFVVTYCVVYASLVRFRAPKWLVLGRGRAKRARPTRVV